MFAELADDFGAVDEDAVEFTLYRGVLRGMLGCNAKKPGHESADHRRHADQQLRFGDRVRAVAVPVAPAQILARKL
jgi:hypothetical protein